MTTHRCPTCGHPLQPHQTPQIDRIAERAAELRRWCEERGHWVSPDGRAAEAVTALILGISDGRLANLRYEGSGPTHYRAGNGRGKVSYRLTDLAAFIENGRT